MRHLTNWLAIDALTLCYTPKTKSIQQQLFSIGGGRNFGDFYLIRTYNQVSRNYAYEIRYQDALGIDSALGVMSFNIKPYEFTNEFYVWIKLNNKALYDGDWWCLSYVSQVLGLVFHNFSRMEISIDTNGNPLRLYENLKGLGKLPKPLAKTIYNSRVVDWNAPKEIVKRQIRGLRYNHLADSDTLSEKTLYVEPKKNEAFLKIYNKKNEIESESGKYYIMEKYGNPKQLYRIELTAFSEDIKEYTRKHKDIKLNPIALFQEKHILGIFKMFSRRLLRWNIGRGLGFSFADIYNPQKCSFEYINNHS